MEITKTEINILSEMAQHLKKQNKLYSKKYRLTEQFLFLSLSILLELNTEAALLLAYVKALRLRSRLITVYNTYLAGKSAGFFHLSCDVEFLNFLCSVFSSDQAEKVEALIWRYYREISEKLSRPDLLDNLTDLYQEMQSPSAELALEVYEAGYIAGLKKRGC